MYIPSSGIFIRLHIFPLVWLESDTPIIDVGRVQTAHSTPSYKIALHYVQIKKSK